MSEKLCALLILLPSLLHWVLFIAFQQTKSKRHIKLIANLSGITSLLSIVFGTTLYSFSGAHPLELFDINGLGLSLRIDMLSLIMFGMVSIIAFFVYRFSINYLDGDPRFVIFTRIFFLIVGSVQLLTLSGNLLGIYLMWVITSLGLQKLLTLYPERKKALLSAKTKFIMARIADLCLFASFSIIYSVTGTGDLSSLLYENYSIELLLSSGKMETICVLLGLTAVFKSVQFPFHTWLIGVLESPTPVSALLHAGLLNAGPFLIIRFSPIFQSSEITPILLLFIGGFSAIFGSVTHITQSSIKSGLVYSSIGHMGFSLMLCGFGLYSAALLHLVSHSFYKAHAFLKSGSVIEDVRSINTEHYTRLGRSSNSLFAFVLTIVLYSSLFYLISGFLDISSPLAYLGLIIFMGAFALLNYSLDAKNALFTGGKALLIAIATITLFYLMESGMEILVTGEIPHPETLKPSRLLIIYLLLGAFLGATLLQLVISVPSRKFFGKSLRVHLRNGLYIDLLLSRIIKVSQK
ncbi:MAG: NADH/ubiquinone/plastoquinone (complex i) [Bacteroidetes bacterium]|nr:MAG: NADH/ubiquinone/plastoquinone (complex i) [Bacteroidota bacterium]